jgi:hypothetical protein
MGKSRLAAAFARYAFAVSQLELLAGVDPL